jgi:hypothetical protein
MTRSTSTPAGGVAIVGVLVEAVETCCARAGNAVVKAATTNARVADTGNKKRELFINFLRGNCARLPPLATAYRAERPLLETF